MTPHSPVVLDIARGIRSLGEGTFDVVLASNLLEHFEPAAASAVIGDVAALLRPRGRFIVIQPNFRFAYRRYFDDYTHVAVYSDVSLCDFLEAHGWRVVQCVPGFLPFSLKSRLPVWPWLIRLYLRLPWKPLAKQMLVRAELDSVA